MRKRFDLLVDVIFKALILPKLKRTTGHTAARSDRALGDGINWAIGVIGDNNNVRLLEDGQAFLLLAQDFEGGGLDLPFGLEGGGGGGARGGPGFADRATG